MARRLATILPEMPLADAIDTTRIYRVAGLHRRPHRVRHGTPVPRPHHTIADVGLIGDGLDPYAWPGVQTQSDCAALHTF